MTFLLITVLRDLFRCHAAKGSCKRGAKHDKTRQTDLHTSRYSSVGKTQKHRGKTDVGTLGRLQASIRA